jgi:hypothetical protein
MKFVNVILACLLVLTGSALAQCPDQTGTWSTIAESNPDYPLLQGRASEAWCDGAPMEIGNTQNVQSWDGAALGTEWHLYDMAIDAAGVQILVDNVVDGNGIRIYQAGYENGRFSLSGDGAWTDDTTELTGVLSDYIVVTTVTYVGGVMTAAVSDITATGTFDGCPGAEDPYSCGIDISANSVHVWQTGDDAAMPMNYPEFLCGANAGQLLNNSSVTMILSCVVQSESRSWSEIKAIHE